MYMKLSLDCTLPTLAILLAIPATPVTLNMELDYSITGSYWAGTWNEPPEYPEFDINGLNSASVEFMIEVPENGFIVETYFTVEVPSHLLNKVLATLAADDIEAAETLAYELAEESRYDF